ncbi:hypothetical protein A3H89_00145 [Candidatus Amesbacteria bacterium RIFCSPLOWO2_02_FULL_48_11]|uniref:FemAB family protein n=3 Tax=Candidatus Amesiibacteriota TaxID=1752730 RepID=A0A0G1XGQ2_9BACT|nr:MAG: FemAB family protein [Candidatus Amesbacteria bacterium GW2011_GWA2_47_11]KKU93505.1 MAG: FemAB family protein [Candidatus Amesbacteria bacterium GW2011_GWC1_48_10]OGC96988.1 MAG: hypothetical protein A3C34_00220 [Candidatus Amesbacteria bacterium RIFCSPHIGHO2_02_FULL_48_21]OGD01634.1 MAG: hypothetical protein A2354_04435 [Candidatus Amesbacteria bacterium RIFOXYB1_FULL_47_12]OGD05672.1 MAG: hypothetical protein A3H89_00145 [Candidatus Amesbacteria bacterium RIFCSPLOWO2_02_FULL_48_11]O
MEVGKNSWNLQVSHPLQSWEWGEFREKRQPVDRINGMLVVWTKIKYTPWCFGYIPMGKCPTQEDLDRLKNLGKRRGAIGIRLEPNIVLNAEQSSRIREQCSVLKRLPKGRSLFKPKTFLVDLTRSEEELLAVMHPKGRYNIKVAQKHNVGVKEDNSLEALEQYLELMFGGTAKRQKIYAHSREYHRQLWEALHPAGMATLWIAKWQGIILAGAMIFRFKDTAYYAYGASALDHKEVMAPTLLLWETIRRVKQQGCKIYDLWGAEEGRGFSRFKEQFGGKLVEMAGTFDLPVNPVLYPLFKLAEGVRWKVLRMLK